MAYSFKRFSDFIYEMTVNASDCFGRSKTVRLDLSFYTHFNYKELLYVSYMYKIDQCSAAGMVYLLINNDDLIYEISVHA